ncbi:hypothetical protein [Rhodococcoides fascians]|uniref:hypothetical protein n=1 Tax=Rhodococcoides fascians TaxID=1828 RepID=UPI000564A8C5|nr:hypothetical protein [Rhodococcus fascians]
MPNSKNLSAISTFAFFASIACLGMMILSLGYYLFTDIWLIATGAVWFMLSFVAGIVSFICGRLSSTANKMEHEELRKSRERESALMEQQRKIDNHLADQQFILESAERIRSRTLDSLDRLPGLLDQAGMCLSSADNDWAERVYNPFWNSIEGCAVKLTEFEKIIEDIKRGANEYEKLILSFDGNLSPFPISSESVEAMNSYKTIYGAMERKTRRALGDIEFAQIFEGWRGNKIMSAGFADLQSAVSEMSTSISREIFSLGSRVDSLNRNFSSLSSSVNGQRNSIDAYATASAAQNTELLRAAKESAYQEKEIAKQLRSIETRYKYSR